MLFKLASFYGLFSIKPSGMVTSKFLCLKMWQTQRFLLFFKFINRQGGSLIFQSYSLLISGNGWKWLILFLTQKISEFYDNTTSWMLQCLPLHSSVSKFYFHRGACTTHIFLPIVSAAASFNIVRCEKLPLSKMLQQLIYNNIKISLSCVCFSRWKYKNI